jgi:hypothetical protein
MAYLESKRSNCRDWEKGPRPHEDSRREDSQHE